jgi:predicted  nucleic acid-binding Zn-ribbon protein
MDKARRDEIRGRLARPHTRDALAPLVTASELRALLDALDAAEAERDDARAEVETLRAEAALLREQLALTERGTS